MPAGGKISSGAKKADNRALIEVEDTGLRSPSETRDRLFKPFVPAGKDQASDWGERSAARPCSITTATRGLNPRERSIVVQGLNSSCLLLG